MVSSCAHIEAGMVPISVSLTDPNSDASDPNIDVFRDDNWFVADVQRTSKRRRCQERNKKKSKHSILHDILLGGAQYMDIAAQLEIHAKQELDHALILSRQIDYLGKMPAVTPKSVRTSKNPKDMLQYDLDNENETIRNYRDRIRQCEALGEYAMAEQIRQILMQEQDHQIDLATALGIPVPDVSGGPKGRALRKPR